MKEKYGEFTKRIDKGEGMHSLPFLNKYYRKISNPITYLLQKTKITPNQVTSFMIFFGCFACLLFANFNYWIWGAILLNVYIILDHVDGDLARAKEMTSEKGYFLDRVSHILMRGILPLAMSIGLWRHYNEAYILIIGLFSVYFVLTDHVFLYMDTIRRKLNVY